MDGDTIQAIDTAHADLLARLLSTKEHIKPPDDDRYYFLVLPHTYKDSAPVSQVLDLALDFSILVKDVLIAEGYEALIASNIGLLGGTLPVLLVPIVVDGVRLFITLKYCFITGGGGTPYYSYFIYDGAIQYGCGGAWDSMQELLNSIPGLISEVRHRMRMIPIYRECSSCQWGDDSGHHCGIGLVGTGECSHYMGPAPHNQQA
jgi:hypothetical protein